MLDTMPLLALTRHWLCADHLRSSFFEAYWKSNPQHLVESHGTLGVAFYWVSGPGVFSSLWFAALFVVIEGYRELTLSDPVIDQLLQSEHVEALRRYRNGVFHFQPSVFPSKLLELHEAHESEQWLDLIHRRLGAYLARKALGLTCPVDQPDTERIRLTLAERFADEHLDSSE